MTQPSTLATPLDVHLRRLLAERRRTGRWLALEAGLNVTKVSRVLRGERDLTIDEAGAVAAALDMELVQLLEGVAVRRRPLPHVPAVSVQTHPVTADAGVA